ncbi:helix-turn-helix transcriptional regulator [Bifidobacterium sp. ESL0769]|uniref:helix-turn-helix domain-containing protein n=1 Tax=Bifidobacterium sp. ESL0769 TaxID=2983229 RepID=UPI0023F7B8EE|nr:helix-turn-helix transcriptional regulator [Bifidobacterium sp. ESL0769]WEV67953.1 helix-turn-helix transcriptional regulator [Bifidobacterium sp. ESL0769]
MAKEHRCNYKDVSVRLEGLLQETKLSRTSLAHLLGVTPSLISQKMKGRTNFTLDDIEKIADLFHVSTDYLLGREPMEVAQ